MNPNPSRKQLFTSLILVLYGLLLGICNLLLGVGTNALTDSEEFKNLRHSYGVGIREVVVGIGVIVILIFLLPYLRDKYSRLDESGAENVEPDMKQFLDSLKRRYQKRLRGKLDGHFEMTLEVAGNTGPPTTHKFPERFEDTGEGKSAGIIREVFEDSGRLLIVGSPGSGKTTLLLKLAVSLLDTVNPAGEEAFPVIFNVASWTNEYGRLEDWLQFSLESGYGLSKDSAATLLRLGRVIPLLDGLDELARAYDEDESAEGDEERRKAEWREAEERREFLSALDLYLGGGRRVVVSCRRKEFLLIQKVTGDDVPFGAVAALLDLTKHQVRRALSEAEGARDGRGLKVDETPAGRIRDLLKRDKGDVLLDTLRTPFFFNTALEVFKTTAPVNGHEPPGGAAQLPDSRGGWEKYLLDKFVAAKLYEMRDRGKLKPEKARGWLKFLGVHLELSRAVDFELSSLQPDDLSHGWLYELLHGSFTAAGIYTCFGPVYSLIYGFYVLFKLFEGSRLGSQEYGHIQTEDFRRVNVKNLSSPRRLRRGVFYGLVFGGLAFLIFNLQGGLAESAAAAALLGAFVGVREIVYEVSYFVSVETPYQRLRAGRWEKILTLAVLCLLMNFISLFASGEGLTREGISVLAAFSLFGGALIGLSGSPLFRHFILRLCLYIEGKAPLKYATFLDYAADARILEKDGGRWRFRHRHLQTHLAGMRGKMLMEYLSP